MEFKYYLWSLLTILFIVILYIIYNINYQKKSKNTNEKFINNNPPAFTGWLAIPSDVNYPDDFLITTEPRRNF